MPQSLAPWRVVQDVQNDEASALLSRDPVWNCFALADLEQPFRQYSQFAAAYQDGSGASALCLILRHPVIGEVISPSGSEQGLAEILRSIDLPPHPMIQAQERHMPVIQEHYRPESVWRKQHRMTVRSDSFQPPYHFPRREARQLTKADLPALEQLYASYGGTNFHAEIFQEGVFFGAFQQELLVAAGGTHVIVPDYEIAVLGHVLTAPSARRQGYATAAIAALVGCLLEQYCSTVILNVFEDNGDALRIYEHLGFQHHFDLFTGKAVLRKEAA